MNDRDVDRPKSRILSLAARIGAGVVFALFFVAFLIGTGQRAEAQSYRFSSVAIEGNQRIETGTILSYAGIARNETVSAGQLNDAYQKILGSGLFEDVELVPQGSNLLIRVVEFPTINQIAFEGNDKIKDDDLAGFIQSKPRQVFSPTQAERDAGIISEAYSQNGRIAARVTPKAIRRQPR